MLAPNQSLPLHMTILLCHVIQIKKLTFTLTDKNLKQLDMTIK